LTYLKSGNSIQQQVFLRGGIAEHLIICEAEHDDMKNGLFSLFYHA
jgi:hypothetical protein